MDLLKPHGAGFKESGIGRTHGAIGFDEMTQPTGNCKRIVLFYEEKHLVASHIVKKLLKVFWDYIFFLYSKKIKNKLLGLLKLLKIFPGIFTNNGN